MSGIHIVINRALVPDCMFLQTNNRRIFFMIPWTEGNTIIGTTERIENSSYDEVKVQEDDVMQNYKIGVIRQGETKLIHVYGGKLTTCLSMAEKVAGRV